MEYDMDVPQEPPAHEPTRQPPHSIQAEVCVLGAMILESSCVPIANEMLRAADFYRPAHHQIFTAIVDMHLRQVGVDLVTLREEFVRHASLEAIGGIEYLVELTEGVPNAANVAYYADIVRRHARSRDLIILGQQLVQDGFSPAEDPADLILQAQIGLHDLSIRCKDSKEDGPLADALDEALSHTERIQADPVGERLLTGFAALDDFCGGFLPGEVVTLGARQTMGKSTLASNIAAHLGKSGRSAIIVSGEMPRSQVAKRLIQSMGHIWGSKFRRGDLSEAEWEYAYDAAEAMKKWRLHVVGKPLTVPQISMKAHQLESQWGRPADLVIIDYLQIMKPHEGRTIREQIIAMSRDIKQLAMERRTVVLLLSQLSRPPKDSKGKQTDNPPSVYDLRESGTIEQDADFVLLMHKPDPQPVYPMERTDRSLELWLKVAKGRDTGDTPWPSADDTMKPGIRLRWWPALTLFADWMSPLDTMPRLQSPPKAPVTERSKFGKVKEPLGSFLDRMIDRLGKE